MQQFTSPVAMNFLFGALIVLGYTGSTVDAQVPSKDERKGELIGTLHGSGGGGVVFSSDGSKIITFGGKELRVWNAMQLTPITDIVTQETWVFTASFDRKGSLILTTNADHVRTLDAKTGRLVMEFHHPAISSSSPPSNYPWGIGASFTPDDSRIVTGRQDNATLGDDPTAGDCIIGIWDATTSKNVVNLKHNGTISYFTVSSAGAVLALAESRRESAYHLWDLPTFREVAKFNNPDNTAPNLSFDQPAASFSANGSRAVLANRFGFEIRNLSSGQQVIRKFAYGDHEDLHGQGVEGVVMSPDGRKVAMLAGHFANIWDVTGKQLTRTEDGESVNRAVFSPDSQYVVFSGVEECAGVWDLSTGKRTQLITPDKASDAGAFAFDSRGILLTIGHNPHRSDHGGDTYIFRLPKD